jgi:hypothetical protein
MNKVKRLSKGSWEKNGSLFEADYHILLSTVCHLLDPYAVRRGIPYTNDILDKAVKYLKATNPGEPFTREKVALYANATATDTAFINKDLTEDRVANYSEQINSLRKLLIELK